MTEQNLAWLASVERGEIEIGPFGRQYRVEPPRGRPRSDNGNRSAGDPAHPQRGRR